MVLQEFATPYCTYLAGLDVLHVDDLNAVVGSHFSLPCSEIIGQHGVFNQIVVVGNIAVTGEVHDVKTNGKNRTEQQIYTT